MTLGPIFFRRSATRWAAGEVGSVSLVSWLISWSARKPPSKAIIGPPENGMRRDVPKTDHRAPNATRRQQRTPFRKPPRAGP
jgi:hypothetical protein